MLQVRLIVEPMNAGAAKEVWRGVVAPRLEKKVLKQLQTFANEPSLGGEMLGFRVKDGVGGGCQAAGPMLGAQVTAVAGGYEAEVTFAGNDWKVW